MEIFFDDANQRRIDNRSNPNLRLLLQKAQLFQTDLFRSINLRLHVQSEGYWIEKFLSKPINSLKFGIKLVERFSRVGLGLTLVLHFQ